MSCLYQLIYYEGKNIGFSNFEIEDEKEYELQEVNGEIDIQDGGSMYHVVIKEGKTIIKYPLMEKEMELEAQIRIQRGEPIKRKYYNCKYLPFNPIPEMPKLPFPKPPIKPGQPNFMFNPPMPPGPFKRQCNIIEEQEIRPYKLKLGIIETEYYLENNIIGSTMFGRVEVGIPKISKIHITFKVKE